MEEIKIPYNELKSLVLEGIRKHNRSFQFGVICTEVVNSAINKGLVPNQIPTNSQITNISLAHSDKNRVREVIWDLITERVVTIGDYHNDSWPFLSLTEYGMKVISSEVPVPNDVTGYLSRFENEIPDVDEVILTYLSESIRTYNINQLLSSTITLGCASEKALLILIKAFCSTFKEIESEVRFRKKIEGRFIKFQFDEFNKLVTPILSTLPSKLKENYDNTLRGIFEMIRTNRNEAGHPTGKKIDKDSLYANLQIFITYCKYIYELKSHFENEQH